MDNARLVRISKYLSKHLRHQPERIGLQLEPGGWVAVDDLLQACARNGFKLSRAELDEVVRRNDKQRFTFDATSTRIRAQQGHSVQIDLELEPVVPPPVLYHGTVERNLAGIMRDGLLRMSRHHVHLSPDVATARTVGARRGKLVVFAIDAAAMHHDGFAFRRSGNGVWLVEHVPPQYLQRLKNEG
jgi:putative RNA 2'-phosphotransferase